MPGAQNFVGGSGESIPAGSPPRNALSMFIEPGEKIVSRITSRPNLPHENFRIQSVTRGVGTAGDNDVRPPEGIPEAAAGRAHSGRGQGRGGVHPAPVDRDGARRAWHDPRRLGRGDHQQADHGAHEHPAEPRRDDARLHRHAAQDKARREVSPQSGRGHRGRGP